jgi:hypothetical protein
MKEEEPHMGKRKQMKIRIAEKKDELTNLYEELSDTKLLLSRAYTVFNYSTDKELIEASIYEISSLQSKYSYLLRAIKEITEMEPELKRYIGDNAVFFPKGGPI